MKENEAEKLKVFSFSPFGYEGAIVNIETNLRYGIPAVDIVGITDSAVKESRETILSAFRNSGLEFPDERVLMSASPADLKKENPMELAMALSVIAEKENLEGKPILALGKLEPSGEIIPVRGSHAAVTSALATGITDVICDKATAKILKEVPGINILGVDNLKEAAENVRNRANFIQSKQETFNTENIEFNETCWKNQNTLENDIDLNGHFDTCRAIEIAVAGKHHILQTGAPGCGKTILMATLIPALTPKLTKEENVSVSRIYSLAGLDAYGKSKSRTAPFRMPHQTASIEGICGGGISCRPGEISLAHNGTLFLDEAAEFKTSVLQMLRVPLEMNSITLSRAGRATTYPANFQLAMAMNPCPCGNLHSPTRICLDSAKSVELYWRKISFPLLDKISIKTYVQKDENDSRTITVGEMREHVKKAYEIQRKRGVFNEHLTPAEINEYCKLSEESKDYFKHFEDKKSPNERSSLLRVSLTIANMDGREEIRLNDLQEANELCSPIFGKPNKFKYHPEISAAFEKEKSVEISEPIPKESAVHKKVDKPKQFEKQQTEEKEKPSENSARKKKKNYEIER